MRYTRCHATRSWPRRSASTSSSGSFATNARSGRRTGRRSRRSRSNGTSPCCEIAVIAVDPEELGRALADAPDPELARVALSRVGEDPRARNQFARPDLLPAAVRLLGFSSAATDFFVAHPEEAESLADLRPRMPDELHM